MMRQFWIYVLIPALVASSPLPAAARSLDFRGEASCWGRGWDSDRAETFCYLLEDCELPSDGLSYSAGIRYIPMLTAVLGETDERLVDLDIAADLFAAAQSDEAADDWDADLYRLKLRFASPRTETRIGLQKITFGPAQLLRSLRWFDRLDPRDPQQLTEGVRSLLFRFTARDNASLLLWGIYPNGKTKGLEVLPSEEGIPEGGGRYQRPLFGGEAAVTFHTRRVEFPLATSVKFRENRFALDGRWDVGVGLWFEAVFQEQRHDRIPFPWTRFLTVGADYTIGAGNGFYIVAEHLVVQMTEETFGRAEEDANVTAWMASYPLGILDTISAVGIYSWDGDRFTDQYSQYVSFRRTWDNWVLDISVFHYPGTSTLHDLVGAGYAAAGTGGQVLLIFNH